MVPERFERYISPAARGRIAALAAVDDDDWMQDWPLEVSDPARLDEFIVLLEGAENDDDRFALMELVLFSLELAEAAKQREAWRTIEAMLKARPSLYACEIIYWSCGEELGDGTWTMDELGEDEGLPITYLMRPVLVRVADAIGLRLV